ncbi:Synaptotagmin-2 [Paragonimus heterotremus]|uniref:Synaptotagmin-2 n=1 Tax=Paragonimus heterotremus TaxID=100268 RepID=A0A8J4TC47_9TREM|nr:Synaptotagmin-2 [Paragonimus heterotremus]
MEATGLRSTCDTETLDAYVSLKQTTSKHGKLLQIGKAYKTDVQRKTKLPRWNYNCSFEVTPSDLTFVTLIFDVFDHDSIGQDRHIGRLTVSLSNFNVNEYTGKFHEDKGQLQPGEARSEGLGELCVGLTYKPKVDRLEVVVYEARQLGVFNLISIDESYRVNVRVELRYRRKLLGTFITESKSDLVNPYFNEKVQFNLQKRFITEAYVLCRLRLARRLSGTLEIATLTIGPNSEPATGAKHWEEMLRNSPRTHVLWHIWIHSPTKAAQCSIL